MKAIKNTIKKLKVLFKKDERRGFFSIFILTTIGAFLEMLGVSLVVPLVSVIMDPEVLTQGGIATKMAALLRIETHQKFILCCLLLMIAVFIIKDLFLIFMNYVRASFIYTTRHEMQKKVLHNIIRKPYEYFLGVNSGDTLRLVTNDIYYTFDVITSLLSLISESIVSLALIAAIFVINPLMTVLISVFLAILLFFILKKVKPAVKEAGLKHRKSNKVVYQWLLQTVQGIKEIKVAGQEPLFEQRFSEAGEEYTEADRLYYVVVSIPKILVEMGCICSALSVMALMVALGKDPKSLVTAFAAFAMAAVKLMPASNRILNSINDLTFHSDSIDRITELLQETDDYEAPLVRTDVPITLEKEVTLCDVTYSYPDGNEDILTDVCMTIPAGHSVGIVGPSGAGKTTAADILLGLLKPQSGKVFSDGTDITENYPGWLDLVAYIPQTIFMLDGSIRENILFGEQTADEEKIWQVLEDVQLADFVRKQPMGIDTQIGERGIRLSGGQRQRIGIARALYTNPQLLVFDEATSSLDNETEAAIIASINELHGKKTMVIIAHRLQTIENCDIVYKVKDQTIEKVRP